MRTSIIAFVFSFVIISFQSLAQEAVNPNRFEIEVDPIAYIFKGYSGHVGYTMGHFRYDVGVFGIKQPDAFLDNDLFSVRSSGVGVKVDYLIKKNKGLFFGLQSDYTKDKIGLKTTDHTQTAEGLTYGIRGGYRFMFGKKENNYKGLYLVPWIALINSPKHPTIMKTTRSTM